MCTVWALLGVDAALTAELAEIFHKDGNEILKPGFLRISLPYYASDAEISFVADAVAFVAEHGWKLLPQYAPNARDATWRHVDSHSLPPERTLASVDYSGGAMRIDTTPRSGPPRYEALLAEALAHADAAFEQLKLAEGAAVPTHVLDPAVEEKRWFFMPCEAADLARGIAPKAASPFWPPLRGTEVPLLQKKMPSCKVVKGAQAESTTSTETAVPPARKESRRRLFPWRKPSLSKLLGACEPKPKTDQKRAEVAVAA
jgi:hypothetical protein